MTTYIVLLRGINVSGHKKIKMADLREALEKLDFQNVDTYIQSGNIVLRSGEKNTLVLSEKIKKAIGNTFGFTVPVLVKSRDDFKAIFERNPFTTNEELEDKRVYFVLLNDKPKPHLVEAMSGETFLNERFLITDDCVYLSCLKGYGNAKLNNNLLERKLKVEATTRNHMTMVKLLEMTMEAP